MTIKSNAEQLLHDDLVAAGFPPTPGHCFHPSRKWALDLAYIEQKLAVEIDGRWHNDHKGKRLDQEKRNAALEMGWRILCYPARETVTKKRRARIVEQIKRVICGVECPDSAACVLCGE